MVTGAAAETDLLREETFGPVAPIVPVKSLDEAIELANGTRFGLGANVYTRDLTTAVRCMRELRAGTVWINDPLTDNDAGPFGGFKQSGLGRELGREGLEAFQETKHVHMETEHRAQGVVVPLLRVLGGMSWPGGRLPGTEPGVLYLTEGGQETELMYKHGHELPEFAMYPLLDDPRAVADLTDMYTRYLEVAAAHGFVALMGGLDYRASPDWASKLGISPEGLAEFQLRSIDVPARRRAAVPRGRSRRSSSPASSARAATPTARTARSPPRRPRSTTPSRSRRCGRPASTS